MTALTLPRLVGSRKAARKIVDDAGEFAGRSVVLDCRNLKSAPPSFADEIVIAVLVDGRASSLELLGASHEFVEYVRSSMLEQRLDPSLLLLLSD